MSARAFCRLLRLSAAVLVGTAVLSAGVTGCSSTSSGALPTFTGSATPSAAPTSAPGTASASGAASSSATGLGGALGPAPATLGTVVPTGLDDQQRAVLAAWKRYWDFRMSAYGAARLDPATVGAVATGETVGNMASYVDELKRKHQHTVGALTLNVLSVHVSGASARLADCTEDRSADVADATGRPVDSALPASVHQLATLVRSGATTWRVATVHTSPTSCRVPR